MKKDLNKKSRWMALLLRHNPEKGNIVLDSNGWALVNDITDPSKGNIPKTDLEEIVRSDEKGRYEFNENMTKIRAVQGHSIKEVKIEMEEVCPPDQLFHGTKISSIESIKRLGLQKMTRQHVHLSENIDTARVVADRRKGYSIILSIDSKGMHEDGINFYRAKNGVWLVEEVPVKYITVIS